jgi:hypothetical protein
MATKKDKPAPASKAVAGRATARTTAPPAALAASETGNSQRLLREAAWSRMFGRTEAKNPFARSR